MNVNFFLTNPHARAPVFSTRGSAGFDIFSCSDDCVISPKSQVVIQTFLTVEWDDPNVYLQLFDKSSLALKGINVKGGVIDYDYKKPIQIILFNNSDCEIEIKYQQKICQGIFLSRPIFDSFSVSSESNGRLLTSAYFPFIQEDRYGGFGSTGEY